MAAVVTDGKLDLKKLRDYLSANLPEYAQPLFLRIKKELDVTGTFKQRKLDLVKDGFDPGKITDDLYFNDLKQKSILPLDPELHKKIVGGTIRL